MIGRREWNAYPTTVHKRRLDLTKSAFGPELVAVGIVLFRAAAM
jgi:hypothetical protein